MGKFVVGRRGRGAEISHGENWFCRVKEKQFRAQMEWGRGNNKEKYKKIPFSTGHDREIV